MKDVIFPLQNKRATKKKHHNEMNKQTMKKVNRSNPSICTYWIFVCFSQTINPILGVAVHSHSRSQYIACVCVCVRVCVGDELGCFISPAW